MRSFSERMRRLEALERAQHGECRGYVVVSEEGEILSPCPCGRDDEPHKGYYNVSPDDWEEP